MPGRSRPRGEMMRDCSKSRAGYDRILMAVAATFLTVSATSALAQSDPAHKSPAELAIDAAVPVPEPANVPPPTVNDFKPDTAAVVAPAAPQVDTPKADTAKAGTPKVDGPKTDPAKAVDKPAEKNPADVAA